MESVNAKFDQMKLMLMVKHLGNQKQKRQYF